MATRVVPIPRGRRGLLLAEQAARRSSRLTVALLIPVGLLAVVGLGAILSASSVYALESQQDSLFYFKRQLMWLAAGVVGLAAAAALPVRWWRRLAFPFFVTTLLLLAAVQLMGIRVSGSERWLALGPVTLQPSEFAKLATVLFLATLVSRREDSMHRFRHFFWPVAGSVGVVGILVMLQPDLGTTLLIAAGGFAVLVASAAPLAYVLGGGAIGAAGAVAAALLSPYRWERVVSFLDVNSDPLGSGYQAMQSLVALGTGGLFGVGLGASRARWSFLPNAHTDFIFAIVGEETGLAGSLAVVLLFAVLTVAGILTALHCSDRFGRLVAIGITTWLVAQALVNIGGVTGVLPITGVPLPFVSFGGSALLTEMVGVGILVAIVRQSPAPEAG
ncbi:MAG TPA: putative lipid II flippase FtsW [Acidimicrobiia bacterium]|nr:putative lipid II flippase FtsW [Acidimicrobiia bacterium]